MGAGVATPLPRPDLALLVRAGLPASGATVFAVAEDASDTAAFSARSGVDLDDCTDTVVLRTRAGGVDRLRRRRRDGDFEPCG